MTLYSAIHYVIVNESDCGGSKFNRIVPIFGQVEDQIMFNNMSNFRKKIFIPSH